MRREGIFKEFVSFVNNPDGTPRYENTVQYAIKKRNGIGSSFGICPVFKVTNRKIEGTRHTGVVFDLL